MIVDQRANQSCGLCSTAGIWGRETRIRQDHAPAIAISAPSEILFVCPLVSGTCYLWGSNKSHGAVAKMSEDASVRKGLVTGTKNSNR